MLRHASEMQAVKSTSSARQMGKETSLPDGCRESMTGCGPDCPIDVQVSCRPEFFRTTELREPTVKQTGTVKWFNDAKGFGFIEPDAGGPDVFAHFSAIEMDGFRTLKQGGKVSFEMVQGPKGQLAQSIQPVEAVPAATV